MDDEQSISGRIAMAIDANSREPLNFDFVCKLSNESDFL
jgi:hypothetical protein